MWGAMGCNPQEPGSSLEAIGGFALGSLIHSPDGNVYICVQADGAIAQYDLCALEAGFQIDQAGTGDAAGSQYCIPQVAMSNNQYGWALICGSGRVKASGAAVTNSNFGTIAGAGTVSTGSTTDTVAGLSYPADSGTAARNIACHVMFPKKVT